MTLSIFHNELPKLMKADSGFEIDAEYRMTVCSKDKHNPFELAYVVELGVELAKLSQPLQKRWVRKRVEQEYGSPVKNPTQKRYVWEPYFKTTDNITIEKDGIPVWRVIIKKPGAV